MVPLGDEVAGLTKKEDILSSSPAPLPANWKPFRFLTMERACKAGAAW